MKTIKFFIIVLSLMVFTSCATTKKNTYYQKKKHEVVAPQLGKSRYFYTKEYQKKLTHTMTTRKVKY
jgi:hypothetical protein